MPSVALGQILVADHQGVYVIKMVGDVRLTLCVSFDQYIQQLFARNDFCAIVFDLAGASCLDSTTLGFIAKAAVKSEKHKQIKPVVICSNTDVLTLLRSMGIDEVCQVIDEPADNYCETNRFLNLEACDDEECLIKEKVLESHCVLMGLNETNHKTFKDLVKTLEGC